MPAPSPSRGELPIIQATMDLIQWFVPLLNRLPRDHRFALGDRLVHGLYDLLEGLVAARYANAKLEHLDSKPLRGSRIWYREAVPWWNEAEAPAHCFRSLVGRQASGRAAESRSFCLAKSGSSTDPTHRLTLTKVPLLQSANGSKNTE